MIADKGFGKNFRLLSASDFARLKKNAQLFKSHTFFIYHRSNQDLALSHARLGIAVSKKVGKAHDRNRLKRIIRELFRQHDLKNKPFDLLIVVQKPKRYDEQEFSHFESVFLRDLNFAFSKMVES